MYHSDIQPLSTTHRYKCLLVPVEAQQVQVPSTFASLYRHWSGLLLSNR